MPRPTSFKAKRCNFFDDDGRPRNQGCPRSADTCNFVHPEEPEWPRLRQGSSGYSRTNHSRSRSREHRSYSRDSREPRSPTTGRNFAMMRRDSIESRRGRRSRSPASASSYNEAYRRRDDPTDYAKPPVSTMPQPPKLPVRPPPPPPNYPPPPIVPRPPPPPPAFLSSLSSNKAPLPTKHEPTDEEKRTAWGERIRLISDSVESHREFTKLHTDLQFFKRLRQTSRYPSMDEQDKFRLETQLTDAEARCVEKKNELQTILTRLSESDSWPVAQLPDWKDVESKYNLMVSYVGELKDTVTQMNDVLNGMITERLRKAHGQRETPNDSRPLKRRRLTDENGSVDSPPGQEGLSAIQIEAIHDRLVDMERVLSDMENSMLQHNAELLDEVDSRLEGTIEKLNAADLSDNPLSITMQGVEKNLDATGDQVGVLAEEVGALIVQSRSQDAEITRLKQENEQLKNEFILMDSRLKECIAIRDQNMKDIQALRTAVIDHLARPPSPPPSPVLVPTDYIVQMVEGHLLDTVRATIQPLIDKSHSDMEDLLRVQDKEMYDTLWAKLNETLQMMEDISKQM